MKNNKRSSLRWILFVASRYISKTGKRSSISTVLSVLGIAVGVLALTVIIAVMNGFQMGFIESILEISSYHIRIDNFPQKQTDLLNNVSKINGVTAAVPFIEIKGIIQGHNRSTNQHVAVIRGVPPDAVIVDKGLNEKLQFESGSFDLYRENSILLGAELAARLSVRTGDKIDFWTINSAVPFTGIQEDMGEDSSLLVKGIFRTGFYEYDLSWAFLNLDKACLMESNNETCTLGIKIKNRWQLDKIEAQIKELISAYREARVTTWRDYNKAFFGALRTEKLMMFVLVGLIFIVVALNIYQSQKRTVLERSEEIGLLRSVGAATLSARFIFVFDGIILGLVGSGSGMILALLIASHIKEFFTALEIIVNFIISLISTLVSLAGASYNGENFYMFSPAVFYIKEIPSRIIPHEVIFIFLFGFLSAVFAAWFASKRVSIIKPAEILRYE